MNGTIKIWRWAALALAVLNISILGFVFLHHRPEHFSHSPKGNPGEFLSRELNFNDAQQKQFEILRNAHRSLVDSIQFNGRTLHHQFFQMLNGEQMNETKIDSFAQLIAYNQSQLEVVTFRHFQQVRNICSDEQKKKFDRVIEDVLKMFAADRHAPPR